MSALWRLRWAAAAVLAASSCGGDSGPISARISALGEAGLPDDATCLQVLVNRPRNPDEPAPEPRTFTVAGLEDRDGNGRPEQLITSQELPPFGTVFQIQVAAFATGESTCARLVDGNGDPLTPDYVGSTGRIRLQPGERRILDLALYQTEEAELLERGDVPAPRWLHSSTLLDDGRILIAGGFTTLSSTTCPSDVVADRCFAGRATNDAFIFDPPTGRFIPVEGGMLEARGGHSATLIGGGRVLLAGGAPEAILAVSDEDSDGPLDLRVLPIGSDGVQAHATFELFDRTDPDLSEDPTRRGFPGRGVFTGSSAEPGLPGQLNRERFLHAASAADMGRFVVLSGGIGADNPTRSYEIFDRAKPGGEGVYRDLGTLQTPRPMPSSFVLNDRVWIWGGGAADDAMDIAEVWNSEVPGTTRAVALPTSGEAGGAEFDLVRPSVAVGRTNVGGRDQEAVVVVGWYGPRCAVDGDEDMPTFEGLVRTRCVQPTSVPFRNALVREDPSGDAVLMAFPPSSSLFQSFSASALRGVDTALITGGIGNDTFETRPNILGLGFGDTRVVDARTMLEARAFHQSTLTGDQLVSTGGLTIRGGNFSMTPAFAESLVFAAE